MATFTLQRSSNPIEDQGSKQYDNQFPSLSQMKPRSHQTWGPSTNKSTYKRSYNQHAVNPKKTQSKRSAIECAYCHEQGHHIKHCHKAANATVRKQNAKKYKRQQKIQLKKSRAVERIREQVIASQQYSQISIENPPSVSNSEDLKTGVMSQKKMFEHTAAQDESEILYYASMKKSNPVTNEAKSDIKTQIKEKEDLMKTLNRWADKCDLQEEIDELEQLL